MSGKHQGDKVKHLVNIFEESDAKSQTEKRSSKLTVVARHRTEVVLCDHCLFVKKEEKADGFCKTCLEYLCARCVKEHVRGKLTREHSLVRNNVPKEDAAIIRRMRAKLFCNKHSGQTIAYYCQAHDEYSCYLCKENNYKECKITSLIGSAQSNSDSTKNIFVRIHKTRDKAMSLKDVKEKRIKSLLEEKHQIQREQREYFKELSEKVTESVKRETAKCEELVGTMVRAITNEVKECKYVIDNDACQAEMLEAALQNCSDDNLALITKVIERKMETLEAKSNRLEQESVVKIHFCKDETLLESLSEETVTVLHSNGDTPSREHEISSDKIETIQAVCHAYVPHSGVASYAPQRRTGLDCNIRLSDDYATCSVWGLVAFPNGRLVLIDNTNLKIKLFTKKFYFVCAETVQDQPTSISQIFNAFLAVKQIQNGRK